MTKNAKIVLEMVNSSHEHLTAEQIYKRLENTENRMSVATVYNSLNSLCDEGLIRRLVLAEQSERYDKLLRHDHLVCKRCGAVRDVFFDDLTAKLNKACGESIEGYDLNMHYICESCRD